MANVRDEQHRTAIRLYGQALAIIDPIRVRMWNEAELTTGQLRLMFFLREQPGATLRDLAAFLSVSAPTASGLVERLGRQEYIRREEDERDRRYVRHYLTARGRALTAEFEREGRALLNEIFGRMSDADLAQLIRALEALAEAARVTAVGAEAAR